MLASPSEEEEQGGPTLAAPDAAPPKRKLRSRKGQSSSGAEGGVAPGIASVGAPRRTAAPPVSLKRKLRTRKADIADPVEEKFVPLVPGARTATSESILSAYAGDSLAAKQEAGEDFWVDPQLLQKEVARTRAQQARTKLFKRREKVYSPDKLKSEISSPYRNNAIGYVVLTIAVVVTGLSFFPELLELNSATPTFPDAL